LVLATGCHERSIPFPSWQLPGVMLMGGAQLQLKSGLVRPGSRMIVVGTGVLLPLIACQASKAGVDVVGVYEASAFGKLLKEVIALLNKPRLALNGFSLLAYLRAKSVPFHYGWGVCRSLWRKRIIRGWFSTLRQRLARKPPEDENRKSGHIDRWLWLRGSHANRAITRHRTPL